MTVTGFSASLVRLAEFLILNFKIYLLALEKCFPEHPFRQTEETQECPDPYP